MKDVIYMGQTFSVPDEAKWIAADETGQVRAFVSEPVWESRYGLWNAPEVSTFVGTVRVTPPCEAC